MKIPVMALTLLMLSCSSSDEFSSEKSHVIQLKGISCVPNKNELSLYEDLWLDTSGHSIKIPLSSIENYVNDRFWIINNRIFPPNGNPYKVGYGEHSVKLVLVDIFGDTLSTDTIVQLNEPLNIELFSPIDGFSDFSETDSLEFRYKISGVDSWEHYSSFVYVSTDKKTLWEEEKKLSDNILTPLDEPIYFWGVKADTVISEIRCIGKFC